MNRSVYFIESMPHNLNFLVKAVLCILQAFKEQETVEDRLVNAKHLQISLSKEEA
jgi:hypothetical protein